MAASGKLIFPLVLLLCTCFIYQVNKNKQKKNTQKKKNSLFVLQCTICWETFYFCFTAADLFSRLHNILYENAVSTLVSTLTKCIQFTLLTFSFMSCTMD